MGTETIKTHPFFYGVDWTAIRNIEAPFIPRLKSITDTSYFPTDELDQVPDEPTGGDTTGAHKELAFLGCVSREFRCSRKTDVVVVIRSRGSLSLRTLSDPFILCLNPSTIREVISRVMMDVHDRRLGHVPPVHRHCKFGVGFPCLFSSSLMLPSPPSSSIPLSRASSAIGRSRSFNGLFFTTFGATKCSKSQRKCRSDWITRSLR
jgi:hypothetical protein